MSIVFASSDCTGPEFMATELEAIAKRLARTHTHTLYTHKFRFNYTFHGRNLCECVCANVSVRIPVERNWSKLDMYARRFRLLHGPHINWHSRTHSMTNKRASAFFHSCRIRILGCIPFGERPVYSKRAPNPKVIRIIIIQSVCFRVS